MPTTYVLPKDDEKKEKILALKKEYQDLGIFFDWVGSFPDEVNLKPGELEEKHRREEEIRAELKKLTATEN